jgi:hypothetical protein
MKPLLCLIFLCPLIAIADEAVLKMHVFDADQAEPVNQKNQGLNMIIFDEDNAVDESTAKPVSAKAETLAVDDKKHRYWSFGLKTGYQNESLVWQAAAPQVKENWHAVDLWNIQADLKLKLPVGFLVRGHAVYGGAFAGDLLQSNEFGDSNQAQLTSGYAMEFLGAVGYEFLLGNRNNQSVWGGITPLVGYEYQEQEYQALNQRYQTEWQSGWIGLDMVLGFEKSHEIFMNSSLHWGDFNALGSQSLYSLEQSASSQGYKAGIGYHFRPSDAWAISVGFNYQHWDTKSGNESLVLPSGSVIESELNSVMRDVYGVNVGVEFNF